MAILTWGSGGTYADPKAAWDATPATWLEAYQFLQVGTATMAAYIDITTKDQNGYNAVFTGNGDLLTVTSNSLIYAQNTAGAVTGSLYWEWTTFDQTVSGSLNFLHLSLKNTTNSFECHFRYNKGTIKQENFLYTATYSVGFSKFFVYGNDVTLSYGGASHVIDTMSFRGFDCNIYFEDNLFYALNGGVVYILYMGGTGYQTGGEAFHIRRNYYRGQNPSIAGTYASYAEYIHTDNYADGTYAPFGDHDQLPFDTTQFESINVGTELYGIPKQTSLMYIDATQTSDIADNIVGLNGESVAHMAAGPYTPIAITLPPTNLQYTKEPTGILVTWTPTIQEDYKRTKVYWETTSDPSSFASPKTIVNDGVTEYLIPTAELSGASLWYVGLKHTS